MPISRSWQVRIFVATWTSYAGFYLCRKNFSVLMPLLVSQAGYTSPELASVVFAYSVAYALGQFANGWLSDRFGARPVVMMGMLLSALASALTGFLVGLPSLLALQAVNGAAQACGWSGLVKIMAHWFERERRGVVMAWWSTNYVLGGFLATVFATFAATGPLGAELGWRRGAWAPALFLALLGGLFWWLARERPADLLERVEKPPRRHYGYLAALRNPAIPSIAATYFFVKLTRYSFLFWLPLYLVQRTRLSEAQAGYASSVFELAGFGGVLLSGYASDRFFAARRFPVVALMLFGLAGACLLQPALASLGAAGSIVGIALIGVLTFGPDSLLSGAATQDCSHPDSAGTAAGFVNGVGSSGQLLSPYIVAGVVQAAGWDALFQTFVVLALCGAFLMLWRWVRPIAEPAAAPPPWAEHAAAGEPS